MPQTLPIIASAPSPAMLLQSISKSVQFNWNLLDNSPAKLPLKTARERFAEAKTNKNNLLREHSIDGTGWAPTRTLQDVVWGLNSLFTDLLNFDDPLNIEAAEHHLRDKEDFRNKVEDYINHYAR
ncbi:UNVERIFIED_CONTAM: hypothetical protein K2H54_054563 [Gekko kuhli]